MEVSATPACRPAFFPQTGDDFLKAIPGCFWYGITVGIEWHNHCASPLMIQVMALFLVITAPLAPDSCHLAVIVQHAEQDTGQLGVRRPLPNLQDDFAKELEAVVQKDQR